MGVVIILFTSELSMSTKTWLSAATPSRAASSPATSWRRSGGMSSVWFSSSVRFKMVAWGKGRGGVEIKLMF